MTIEQIGFALLFLGCFMLMIWLGWQMSERGKPKQARKPRSTKAPIGGDLLRPKEVSRLLGIPVSTLALMRSRGTGPAFFQDGRPIYYKRADVEAWMVRRARAGDNRRTAAEVLGIQVERLPSSPHRIHNAFLGDDDPSDTAVRA